MPNTPKDEQYSDEEAERRATSALRRALSTPYKPQREMVGKAKTPAKAKPVPNRAKKSLK
jgi:hypothetical protein